MSQTKGIVRIMAGVKDPLHPGNFYAYVLQMAQAVHATHVNFLFVMEDLSMLNIPHMPGLSHYEALQQIFREGTAAAGVLFPEITVTCEIREGDKDELLLHWTKINMPDLLILGRRKGRLHSGSRSIKIARQAPCHVLLVPEDKSWKAIHRILLPVDFSDHSALAVNVVSNISGLQEITCVHVYEMPDGSYYSGEPETEVEVHMLKSAKDAWGRFQRTLPALPFQMVPAFIRKEKQTLANSILNFVQRKSTDLVVLGSKGFDGVMGLLLGSVTQVFIKEFDELPVLVVKRKEEKLSLLEAIIG